MRASSMSVGVGRQLPGAVGLAIGAGDGQVADGVPGADPVEDQLLPPRQPRQLTGDEPAGGGGSLQGAGAA